ncbi:MAG: hypothetical protein ACTHK4_05450 [Mycobacteriales bacterium]
MARTAKKTAARRPAKKTAARPAARPAASASSVQVVDLAGGLKSLLGAVEGEVKAVTALSGQIDDLVTKLNKARTEQGERLRALDALKSAASDGGLSSFLDKLIRPRMPRVPEVRAPR